ncbi:MAG TPA: hypothetical protein VHQ24_17395 [Lachnospiraceae bacterium]|nr:hypothetical protein [Lachnospiraceae bacterium]
MEERKRIYFQLKMVILLLLTLLTWGYSIFYGRQNEVYKGTVSARYDEPTIDYGSIQKVIDPFSEKMDASLLPSISLWNRERDANVVNADQLNETKVDLIRMRGDMSAVEKEHVLIGSLVLSDDTSGCVIDKATAYSLYGSYDILGMAVLQGGERYYIRGILDTSESRMLIQEEKINEKYAYMEFNYRMDLKSSKSRLTNDLGTLTRNFLSQYGFAESRVIADKDFGVDVLRVIYLLPGWFMLLIVVISMLRFIKKASTVPVIRGICIIIMLFITGMLVWIVQMRFQFPERFIPTRWSDFDFWAQKYKEIQANISAFYSIIPLSNDNYYKIDSYRCIVASLLAIILCGMLQSRWKQYIQQNQRNGKHIWGICFCILGVTFFSIIILYICGKAIIPTRAYLTIFIVYIVIWLLTSCGEEYMRKFEKAG